MSVRIYAKEEGGLTPYQVMQREDILNTVTSDTTDKALSAAQGKRLFTQITDHTHALTSASLTGILPLDKGGTGGTSVSSFFTNFGLKNGAQRQVQRGTVSIIAPAGGVGSAVLTFSPVFETPPTVVVSPYTTNPGYYSATTGGLSTSQCTVYIANSGSTQVTISVRYIAIY